MIKLNLSTYQLKDVLIGIMCQATYKLIKYLIKLDKSRKVFDLVPSYKGNFKIKRCLLNNNTTLKRSNKM